MLTAKADSLFSLGFGHDHPDGLVFGPVEHPAFGGLGVAFGLEVAEVLLDHAGVTGISAKF